MNNHEEIQEIQKQTALLQLQVTEKLLKQQDKDFWDKLSIVGSIFGPIIIGVFGLLITHQLNTREIKN